MPGAGRAAGIGNKRLRALAEWHFDGGESYCAACPFRCAGCPHDEHEPETSEGLLAWAVIRRSAGQVRAVMGGVYALDFGAIEEIREISGRIRDHHAQGQAFGPGFVTHRRSPPWSSRGAA